MPAFLTTAATALLATGVAALPSPKSCTDLYERAKHTLPLYRTTDPAEGNFEADITVGSQTVRAVLDTGSSDTWFLPEGYQCLNKTTQQPVPAENCGYGGTRLIPEPSFEEIPNEHINVSYAIGGSIYAPSGYSPISFAGVDVPKQQIGIVKHASAAYSGKTDGLVGLAYPAITNNFEDNDPSEDKNCNLTVGAPDTPCTQKNYPPLLSTIFAEGLVPPVFSFAMSRSDASGGIMTLGGIPDLDDPEVNVTKDATQVTVPIEKLENVKDYAYYVASIGGFQYTGAPEGAGKDQYAVDTGTVPVVIDKENAERFTALFDPPGYQDPNSLVYVVNCTATAPALAVEIGGKTFDFHSQDLILKSAQSDTVCMSGVQGSTSTGAAPPILGSVFLRSVLAVFDVGNTQMTFASRMHYKE